jgi:hypothetical protein
MSTALNAFVQSCPRSQGTSCKVRDFITAFRNTLPATERVAWRRSRIIAEMAAQGYELGMDTERRANFLGIGLQLRVVDGRLMVDLREPVTP